MTEQNIVNVEAKGYKVEQGGLQGNQSVQGVCPPREDKEHREAGGRERHVPLYGEEGLPVPLRGGLSPRVRHKGAVPEHNGERHPLSGTRVHHIQGRGSGHGTRADAP